MKNLIYVLLLSFSLAACTRESSKTTTDNKTIPETDKKQEQAGTKTPQTDNKTAPGGQTTESAGNKSDGIAVFTQKVYKKSYKDCDYNKEDCTNIQIYYLQMTDGKYKDKINDSIRYQAINVYPMDDTRYTDFDKLIARYMKDYEDFKKEVPDAPGAWYLKDTTEIITNTADILCFENIYDSYLGGAHGSYNANYTNFDMRTGNVLKTKDIFNKGYEKTLNKLIEGKIRKHFEMKPGESLQEGGLFENTVSFNENFAITKDGVEFLYNQYEIAAYAMGVIEIKLSYKELESILNKDVIKM